MVLLAFSLQDQVEKFGAYVGIAAFFGLAILTLLYFAQAREVKRLREWAGRAPERAAELEQAVVEHARRARARRCRSRSRCVAAPQRRVPRRRPPPTASSSSSRPRSPRWPSRAPRACTSRTSPKHASRAAAAAAIAAAPPTQVATAGAAPPRAQPAAGPGDQRRPPARPRPGARRPPPRRAAAAAAPAAPHARAAAPAPRPPPRRESNTLAVVLTARRRRSRAGRLRLLRSRRARRRRADDAEAERRRDATPERRSPRAAPPRPDAGADARDNALVGVYNGTRQPGLAARFQADPRRRGLPEDNLGADTAPPSSSARPRWSSIAAAASPPRTGVADALGISTSSRSTTRRPTLIAERAEGVERGRDRRRRQDAPRPCGR